MYFCVTRAGRPQEVQIAGRDGEAGVGKQQTLLWLGRLEALRASGQWDALLRSGLRLSRPLAVLDAQAAGQTEAVAVCTIGPDLGFGRLWEQTGIAAVLAELLAARRQEFAVERAGYWAVLHRLFVFGSDRAAERWREAYRVTGTAGLEWPHWDRAMVFLGEPLSDAAGGVGSLRCVKDQIEEALFGRQRDLLSGVGLGFFDTPWLDFEGGGGQTLGRRGPSKDPRPELLQRGVGFVWDSRGRPLCWGLGLGNTTEVKTLLLGVGRRQERFRVGEVCVLADRGMIRREVRAELEAAALPGRQLLGARMGRQKEVAETGLWTVGDGQAVQPERTFRKGPALLKVREGLVEGRRYVVCWNEEERRKDAQDRAAIVAHLRQQLEQGDKSLGGNKGYRRSLKREGAGRFVVEEERLAAEARFDGLGVLRTNTDYPAPPVALQYKGLGRVEALICTSQSIVEPRPIYPTCDETIRGDVFCSFLAVWLKTELERRLAGQGQEWEWAEVLRGLDHLQGVEVAFRGRHCRLRSQWRGEASQALRAAGVAVPPTIRKR